MKYYLPCFLFLFVFLSQPLCSQGLQAPQLPNYATLAPEVSNIAKYSEIPVSLYTGVPNIGVPIYTITEKDMQLPIALSYHAGGHKVEEIASWAGLGWSLNAGGQVYRITRQLPDDAHNAGFIYTDHLVNELGYIIEDHMPEVYPQSNAILRQARRGMIDFAPDEFHFSFGGHSGRFFFSQNRTAEHPYGEIMQDPVSDIIITPIITNRGPILGWKFATPDGKIYQFGSNTLAANNDYIQSMKSYSSDLLSLPVTHPGNDMNNRPHSTSWKLVSMASPGSGLITFEYEQYVYSNLCNCSGESELLQITGSGYSRSFSETSGHNSRLKKIIFSEGYAEFITQAGSRLDLSYDKALQEIAIYSKKPGYMP